MLSRTLLSHHCALQVTSWNTFVRLLVNFLTILLHPNGLFFCTSCAFFSWSWHCVECCSDGTGRTGTYILIDMVLNRMAKGDVSLFLVCVCTEVVMQFTVFRLNWTKVFHPHRCERDWHCCNAGACPGSEAWHGSHQGWYSHYVIYCRLNVLVL